MLVLTAVAVPSATAAAAVRCGHVSSRSHDTTHATTTATTATPHTTAAAAAHTTPKQCVDIILIKIPIIPILSNSFVSGIVIV